MNLNGIMRSKCPLCHVILTCFHLLSFIAGQVKLLFETVISAFKVVNTLLLCVGGAILLFGNVG